MQSEFLDRLGDAERAALVARLVTRRYGRGETVIEQSDGDRDVYFVLGGLARAMIFSEDGKLVAFRDIGEGAVFGELSAIDGAPRSASVVAVEDLTVGRLPVAEFRRLVETTPSFAWALLGYLSALARGLTERVYEFSTMLVRDRLVHELIRLAEPKLRPDGSAEIRPAPTHFDLAARISTHREAVSREMSRLARAGLVRTDGRGIVIPRVEQLRRATEC